jgi:hypothetical protein
VRRPTLSVQGGADAEVVVGAPPRALADRLADPNAPAAWFGVRVEPNGRRPRRWRAGSSFTVVAAIRGEDVRMAVTLRRVDAHGVAFVAEGPVALECDLRFEREARSVTRLRAHVDVIGRGITGDAVAAATAALLRGRALDHALEVIKDEIERSRR